MIRRAAALAVLLCMAACQATVPRGNPDPTGWAERVDRMDSSSLEIEQQAALNRYLADPVDRNRLRAGYALSRPGASPAQLEQSREILANIPNDSELSAHRDLLLREINLRTALERSQQEIANQRVEIGSLESRAGELEERNAVLVKQIADLESQLEILKSIEEEMANTQQDSDEAQQ